MDDSAISCRCRRGDLDSGKLFSQRSGRAEEERYLAYGTALLLTHYHLHGGPERLAKVREILEKPDRLRKPSPFLTPDDGPAIEAALIRFWRTKGLDLRFANALR
jgi:hypothetical protein